MNTACDKCSDGGMDEGSHKRCLCLCHKALAVEQPPKRDRPHKAPKPSGSPVPVAVEQPRIPLAVQQPRNTKVDTKKLHRLWRKKLADLVADVLASNDRVVMEEVAYQFEATRVELMERAHSLSHRCYSRACKCYRGA